MPAYRERLSPAWWLVLALFLSVPTSVLVFLPLNWALGAVVGLGMWALLWASLWWSAPVIRVDNQMFSVGPASIERRYIASVEAFDGEHARAEKGVNLDARAFVLIRPWVHPVVKITLRDDNDPTPYWLISSRDARRLAGGLEPGNQQADRG